MAREQYHNQLRKLKEDTIRMGNLAKDNVLWATISLKNHDPELAKRVIDAGSEIDELYGPDRGYLFCSSRTPAADGKGPAHDRCNPQDNNRS